MSCSLVANDADEAVCANCGVVSSDAVKLKDCTACLLVKYCGVDCQMAHRKQHKKACKQRAEELKDEQLYSQGRERSEDDFCMICTLPIPLPMESSSVRRGCCLKRVCHGCDLAAQKRGMSDCAFCRTPTPDAATSLRMIQKRVKKKDPAAMCNLGKEYFNGGGHCGLKKNTARALELFSEAADLGSIEAHHCLGCQYLNGVGVPKDEAKAVHYWETAATQGDVRARHDLGLLEYYHCNNYERAVRHWLISAKVGHEGSLKMIQESFRDGGATKAQYVEALKGYQDAIEEMRSPEREEAKRLRQQGRY